MMSTARSSALVTAMPSPSIQPCHSRVSFAFAAKYCMGEVRFAGKQVHWSRVRKEKRAWRNPAGSVLQKAN